MNQAMLEGFCDELIKESGLAVWGAKKAIGIGSKLLKGVGKVTGGTTRAVTGAPKNIGKEMLKDPARVLKRMGKRTMGVGMGGLIGMEGISAAQKAGRTIKSGARYSAPQPTTIRRYR
ncbi:hypothetical protein LCGC14_0147000 [marine sediment metagenome]|uniref:Uncharacterized protein n=1 Tax=marine sediment metagenome TaxID=412755 RepID=A0A0F9Y1K8_9ZZZZ